MNDLISRQKAIDTLGEKPIGDTDWDLGCQNQWEWDTEILRTLSSAEPEQRAKVTLLITGLHSVWGTCECGRQVEKPGRNDQSGAYYCPRCGAKLEWE